MRHQERGGRRHKDLQLCRQVQDALSYALAEISDPLLDDLVLVSVEPAPTTARLLVTLALQSTHQEQTLVNERLTTSEVLDTTSVIAQVEQAITMQAAALARLRQFSAELRQEVTSEINRKRSPELVFRIV